MAQTVKNLPAMQEMWVNPWSGGSPGEGNGSPYQYSCLENSMDRRAWQATVHEVARVRHDLATKLLLLLCIIIWYKTGISTTLALLVLSISALLLGLY